MAKQVGIFKVQGTVDEVTFYHTADGDFVRKKGGVSKGRIQNDPAFARARENMSEFGTSVASAKLLRDNIRPLLPGVADGKLTSRMMQLMMGIQRQDSTSQRGKRSVGVAQALAGAKAMLKNFNFNKETLLANVLIKPVTITPATAVMSITGLIPITDIVYPTVATHVSFSGAVLNINFATTVVDVKYTNVVSLPINNSVSNVTLTPSDVPAGTGIRLYLFKVEFVQVVNGSNYPLKNGSFNALAIIEVV